jgi:nucleoside-diphosphate-sugar epimerase
VRYVVTGAAGFIGSHLADALQARGDDVVALDCFTDYYDVARKEENAAGLDVVRVDLAEDPLDELVAGAAGLFHLAGQPGVRSSWGEGFAEHARHNLVATHRVFEAAARAGVRVVFASSSSVYGDADRYPVAEDDPPRPISAYGITKHGCEQLARAYAASLGLDCVVLRYFTIYGPRQRPDMAFTRVVEALLDGAPFEVYGDGLQSREFTYVSDAVEANLAALERARPGSVYNVSGGSAATLLDAIAILERASGRSLDVRLRPAAAGDVRRTAADTSRIRRELAWSPRVTLADGLEAELAWAAGRVGTR